MNIKICVLIYAMFEYIDNTVWNNMFFRHVKMLKKNFDILNFLTNNDCNLLCSSAYIKTPGYRRDTPQIMNEKIKIAHNNTKMNIVYYVNDHTEKLMTPHNTAVLRVSLKKSELQPNELVIPFIVDEYEYPPVNKTAKPKLSFCGIWYGESKRQQWITAIKDDNRIDFVFVPRKSVKSNYSCNDLFTLETAETIKQREEFIKNMSECEFAFCPVGIGNYSIRFFEAMSMGRIPCVIDTDIALPFEDMINWTEIAVISKDENSLCNDIVKFWATRDIKQAQQKCKEIHTKYFVNELNDILLNKIKIIHNMPYFETQHRANANTVPLLTDNLQKNDKPQQTINNLLYPKKYFASRQLLQKIS